MDTRFVTTINNKRIYDFYNSNTNISIESVNLIFLDLLEAMNTDITKAFTNTKLGEIVESVKEIKQYMYNFNDSLSTKMNDHNRNFLETFKLVIGSANTENNERISHVINQNIDLFTERISLTLPKTQEETNRRINETLQGFQKTLTDDVRTFMMSSHSENSLKDFISTLDSKITIMQQPIYSILSSTQEQMNSRLSAFREENGIAKANSEKIFTELGDFLSKYKNSSQFKGQVSETTLASVISKLYPTAELINTTAQTAAGDFLLKRENKPNIIFENKNYDRNVNIDEVKKFLRDTRENRSCGIMVSQFSGIVGKKNFFIEVNDGKVLIYLHEVQYSPDKIKTAVDIIDNLYERIQSISQGDEEGSIIIKKEVLDVINEQYQLFLSQRENLLTITRDFNKKMTTQLEELKLPELTAYLSTRYAIVQNQDFSCEICGMSFATNRSLGSHKKMHKGGKQLGSEIVINAS